MSTGVWVGILAVAAIIVVTAVTRFCKLRAARKQRGADIFNIARRALEDIEFNRRELVHPTSVTELALKISAIEELLTNLEFVEVASIAMLEALRAYREFTYAVGRSAMIQRTDTGEPLVMSRLLAEEGGRGKFEHLSQEAENALQQVFEA